MGTSAIVYSECPHYGKPDRDFAQWRTPAISRFMSIFTPHVYFKMTYWLRKAVYSSNSGVKARCVPICENVCRSAAGFLIALHARKICRRQNANLVNLHRVNIQKRQRNRENNDSHHG